MEQGRRSPGGLSFVQPSFSGSGWTRTHCVALSSSTLCLDPDASDLTTGTDLGPL